VLYPTEEFGVIIEELCFTGGGIKWRRGVNNFLEETAE
jgi:hypothetical protein